MSGRSTWHSARWPDAFVRVCCAAAIGVTGLVLLGWTLDVPALRCVLPGRVAMNPATAICFLLAAGSLSILRAPRPAGWQRLAQFAAMLVAVVGAVKLSGYLLGWNIGIDRLLFHAQLGDNEIAPNTAFNFLALGLALWCLDRPTRTGRWPAHGLAMLVAIGAVLSVVGYAFGARVLYGVPSTIPMALNTATVFCLLSLGLLAARPNRGIAALFLGSSPGGTLARRLVPAAVAIPAIVGWLRLAGQNRGFYDTELGVAVMVAVTIITLLLLILWTAETVNRIEAGRKQAEASLRESEDRFQLLVNSVHDYAIFMLDPEGRVATWNLGAQRILGYTAEEIVGQHVSRFAPNAISRAAVAGELHRAAADGRFEEEARRRRKDGTQFWANVIITPIRSADGRLTGFAKVTRDITRQRGAEEAIRQLTQNLEHRVAERTAELAESNDQLRQQNQENEMFVYSVSHDLRSPLVNLEGFSQELVHVCGELRELLADPDVPAETRDRGMALVDGDVAESIRYINQAVLRLSGIIDSLLRLSRAGRVEYQAQEVDVNAMLPRLLDSMRGTIAERGAAVHCGELPVVWGDPTALELVFANLVGNALKYADPLRPAHVEIGCRPEPSSEENGNRLTFYVRDNGLGIAAEYQERVFQPFKRVHTQVAEGEGMGLAIARRIVERHRGRIWVESAPGSGSTFFVELPVVRANRPNGGPARRGADNENRESDQEEMTCSLNHC